MTDVPTPLLEAQIHDGLGQRAKAQSAYQAARELAEAKVSADPDDSRAHSALGLALAGLGEKQAAIREGQIAVGLMPVAKDGWRGAYRLEDLARIYATVGEREKAVEILTRLRSMPTDLAGPAHVTDPAWAPLRGHPGFERLTENGSRD